MTIRCSGSTSLPLLEGLAASGKSESILFEALRHEEAPSRIQHAVRKWLLVAANKRSGNSDTSRKSASKKRTRSSGENESSSSSSRKRRKDKSTTAASAVPVTGASAAAADSATTAPVAGSSADAGTNTTTTSTSFSHHHHHHHHWWWTSFGSYCASERATAARMLLSVLEQQSSAENAIYLCWRVFPLVLQRFQSLLATATTVTATTPTTNSIACISSSVVMSPVQQRNVPLAPRLALEWMAILEELIKIMVLKNYQKSKSVTATTTTTTTPAAASTTATAAATSSTSVNNTISQSPCSWNILLAVCLRFKFLDILSQGLFDIGRALESTSTSTNLAGRQTQVLRELQRVICNALNAWLVKCTSGTTSVATATRLSTSVSSPSVLTDLPRHLQTPDARVLKLLAKHFLWNIAPRVAVAVIENQEQEHHSQNSQHHHAHYARGGGGGGFKWNALASLIGARFLRSHLPNMVALPEPTTALQVQTISVKTTSSTATAAAAVGTSASASGAAAAAAGRGRNSSTSSSKRSARKEEKRRQQQAQQQRVSDAITAATVAGAAAVAAVNNAAAGATAAASASAASGRSRYLRSSHPEEQQQRHHSILSQLVADHYNSITGTANTNNNINEGGGIHDHSDDDDIIDDDEEDEDEEQHRHEETGTVDHQYEDPVDPLEATADSDDDDDHDSDDDDDDDDDDDMVQDVEEVDVDQERREIEEEIKLQQRHELERLVAADRRLQAAAAAAASGNDGAAAANEEVEAAAAVRAVEAVRLRETVGGRAAHHHDDDDDDDDDDDHCSDDDPHQAQEDDEEMEGGDDDDEDDEEHGHYGEADQSGYVDGHAGGYSEDDDEDDDDHDRMELDEMEDVPFFRAAAASRATATSALAAALAGSNNSNSASALSGASSSHHHHHHGSSKRDLAPPLKERQLAYVQASMIIMSRQYPVLHHQQQQQSAAATQMSIRQPYLTVEAENAMLESINRIVKPPKKPIQTKIIMRRAPTQEEFFRGSLSRNPISVDSLARSTGSSSGGENTATATTPSDSYEPTVGDLRQHIANDLQMADSAELIEIIVANKILDMSLKLRVVHQVLWRKHLMENASSSSAPGGPSFFSVGSGLSMILSTTGGGPACPINADTPLSQLPPMIAMYRLAGVDGEATEDTLGVDELIDPEAPASADSCTPEELQRLLEKDFGITRIVTEGRGILVLLRSIQHAVADTLRRIRRDDVVGMVGATGICRSTNPSRAQFQTSPPCQGLTLLRHCSRLACNRKMLLQARAPTVLLTLLLDVLKSLEDDTTATTKSNPTADILQELIEVLASDISTGASSASNSSAEAEIESSGYESDAAFDASSMPMLLESIETIALSAPLRKIIGKLLPFLTYGQADLSRTLAQHFDRHIVVEALEEEKDDGDAEMQAVDSAKSSTILMHTFVQTAMSLPANAVCNSLRTELINCGFIDRLALFIIKDMPKQPPSWSHALWSNVQQYRAEEASVPTKGKASSSMSTALSARSLEAAWRQYYARSGIQTAFRILTGLCKSHKTTQARVAMFAGFLLACHWIEATSDSSSLGVNTNGLGLLAETLLDEMMEDNKDVNKLVEDVRKKTRLRKKELAQERRNKALGKMSAFGPLAGSAVAIASNESESSATASSSASASVRGAAASILARSVLGFFGSANAAVANAPSAPAAALPSSSSRGVRSSGSKAKKAAEKPSWMTEMESMEDETGLTCAICQEGRTLQPEELLGLYAFVKKISIPLDQCGARSSIDGSVLLKALPSTLPGSLQGTRIANTWLPIGKAAGEELTPSSSMCTSSGGRRMSLFTTTVSAGNGIHLSCHRRARAVDRTHPKAPKSEWEGAKLRNGRVDCNIILPLVSSRSSKVSLIAVDAALSEHQSAVSNLLGATPKSMLWTNLYDTRFLLLRMAYGEALDTDCGGGSLESNCNLLFYQMVIAATFDRDAQMEQPDQSQHARGLSAGFIAACALVTNDDCKGGNVTLTRGIADAAPMACLTSILFHNGNNDGGEGDGVRNGDDHSRGTSSDDNEGRDCPHPNRRWVVARDYFLRGLVICAGRRHALRLESSGCWTSRNVSSRQRSNSYATWGDASGTNTANASTTPAATTRSGGAPAGGGSNTSSSSDKLTIKDFQHALRPMITFYAMMEQLSAEFALNMEDMAIRQGAERLARTIEDCLRCKNIHQLLATAKVTMAPEALLELLQKGMVVA